MFVEHHDVLDALALMLGEFNCNVGPVIGMADGLAKEGRS